MGISLLDNILKLPKKYYPLIIYILLGIIIVGSIGGGFWINNLKNALDERDALEKARLQLIEERYKTNFNSLSLRVDKVESDYKEIRNQFLQLDPDLILLSNNLSEISTDPQIPKNQQERIKDISVILVGMATSIRLKQADFDNNLYGVSLETMPFHDYGSPPMARSSSPLVLLGGICFVGILVVFAIFFLLKKLRKKPI